MAQITPFDSNQHEDMMNFDPVPAGDYMAHIIASEIKKTKDQTGSYIKLEFEILEPEYKHRKIWTNINIENQNPIAVDIAQKTLATLCRAVNILKLSDTIQLHKIPLIITLKIKKGKGDYSDNNVIINYKSLEKKPIVDPDKPSKVTPPWLKKEQNETSENITFDGE